VEFCYLLNPNDANINNYLGYYAKEDGNIPEMIAYFKKAYELAPSDYWYNYNVLLLQTEIKDKQLEAINNLKAVAKANKRDEDVHAVLHKAYISLNLLPEALKVQDALDSIHGYNEQSAIQRYRLNTMMGKNKQSIQEIERYLKEEPENYQFHVFRLQLYEQTKQPADKLIEAYESVLRFDNRNMMWLNNLAWNICISGGDLNKAEELSRTTIMAEPSNSIFLDTYAWILYKKGDYEGAWFYIQRAKEHTTEETDKEIEKHWKAIKRKL
jgi:predicted Zn-dependent protease